MTLRQSKSDILFDRLRHDILTLDLPPGMALRLPALSERYAIGLTPLRECLNRLAAEKLVVPEHNKGFCVPPLTRPHLLDRQPPRHPPAAPPRRRAAAPPPPPTTNARGAA